MVYRTGYRVWISPLHLSVCSTDLGVDKSVTSVRLKYWIGF